MRDVPQVTTRRTADDNAHYAASIALEEVLAWYRDDGYTADDLRELAEDRINAMFEDAL